MCRSKSLRKTQTVCQSIRISDTLTLPLSQQACTVVLGDVRINSLRIAPASFMYGIFQGITQITGSLIITESDAVTSLRMFAQLQYVDSVVLTNNINLVDATLPALATTPLIELSGNVLLCPGRYPVPTTDDTQHCNTVDGSVYFSVSPSHTELKPSLLLELEEAVAARLAQANVC